MGQELLRRSGDDPSPLWATRVMIDHPGLVRAIHADYFAAGATIATTNTYAIHHDRLVKFALDHRFAQLHAAALSEAEAARAAHGSGRIAGSLGPLVASYRPDTLPPHAEAVGQYAEVAALLASRVDLLIGETVASVAHARALVEGARQAAPDLELWLSVTVEDSNGSRLRSGEAAGCARAGRFLRWPRSRAMWTRCWPIARPLRRWIRRCRIWRLSVDLLAPMPTASSRSPRISSRTTRPSMR